MAEDKDAVIIQWMNADSTREKGFRLLMDTFQTRLYQHIHRLVGSHEDTNDTLQNTFIKVFRHWSSYKGESKLYTWLYKIATNEALNTLSQKKKHLTEDIDNHSYINDRSQSALDTIDGESIQKSLQLAIQTLPEKQKAVFLMRYYDEVPYEQMSDIMQTTVGALKASFHLAVKKIEKYFIDRQLIT